MNSANSLSPYRLYLVISTKDCPHLDYFNIIEIALKNGFTCLQLREKQLSTRDFIELSSKVKEISRKHNIPLFINDRIDVALAIGATGVHLGQSDLPYSMAREISGHQLKIGVTLESTTDYQKHQYDLVDYFGLSAIYPSKTKQNCKPFWKEKNILQIKSKTPLIGIGGITTENAQETLKMGFDGIALVSDICSSTSLHEVKSKSQLFKHYLKDRDRCYSVNLTL